jgi:hypothetical protein
MTSLGLVILILFGMGLAALCVVGMIVRALFSRQDNGHLEDETRLVQDMFRTLNKLEERVAVLETLLADRRPSQER